MTDFFRALPEKLLARHRGFKINPPAAANDFAYLESKLGIKVPTELREAYSAANGEPDLENEAGLIGGDYWLTIEQIIDQHEFHQSQLIDSFGSDASVWEGCSRVRQGKLWRESWLPITWGYDGRVALFDTDPSTYGRFGQILFCEHIDRRFGVIADSLQDFLQLAIEESEPIYKWPML